MRAQHSRIHFVTDGRPSYGYGGLPARPVSEPPDPAALKFPSASKELVPVGLLVVNYRHHQVRGNVEYHALMPKQWRQI